jgi:molybdate transport system substrate-binding protein
MRGHRASATAVAVLLGILAAPRPILAEEITLLSPGAMMRSLKQLVPQFENTSKHKVMVAYLPARAIAERVRASKGAGDVVILGADSVEALEKLGKLAAGTTVIARTGVGVFVRRGDPRPDISSVEAFTRALMIAKVIAYSDPALGGSASNYVSELLAKLDVAGSIKSKVKLATQYRSLANMVAAGGVDFGLNQIAEIRADARLELVGPLPGPLQRYTDYAAGIVTGGMNQSAGKELIDLLASPAAADIMRDSGFESR